MMQKRELKKKKCTIATDRVGRYKYMLASTTMPYNGSIHQLLTILCTLLVSVFRIQRASYFARYIVRGRIQFEK